MPEFFAYVNYYIPKKRPEIIHILVQGLRKYYRDYDSSRLLIDGRLNEDSPRGETFLLLKEEKASVLADSIRELDGINIDMDMIYESHSDIAHTNWNICGSPQGVYNNSQLINHSSDFAVVRSGTITNHREIKEYLLNMGHKVESEVDAEIIANLIQHFYDCNQSFSFRQLAENVVQQLKGDFALTFKSKKFPGELVASCNRPMKNLPIGIKDTKVPTTVDTSENISEVDHTVREYFIASDVAAIASDTMRIFYVNHGEIASIKDGILDVRPVKPVTVE